MGQLLDNSVSLGGKQLLCKCMKNARTQCIDSRGRGYMIEIAISCHTTDTAICRSERFPETEYICSIQSHSAFHLQKRQSLIEDSIEASFATWSLLGRSFSVSRQSFSLGSVIAMGGGGGGGLRRTSRSSFGLKTVPETLYVPVLNESSLYVHSSAEKSIGLPAATISTTSWNRNHKIFRTEPDLRLELALHTPARLRHRAHLPL